MHIARDPRSSNLNQTLRYGTGRSAEPEARLFLMEHSCRGICGDEPNGILRLLFKASSRIRAPTHPYYMRTMGYALQASKPDYGASTRSAPQSVVRGPKAWDEENAWIADNLKAFACAVVTLLRSPLGACRLGESGKTIIHAEYGYRTALSRSDVVRL